MRRVLQRKVKTFVLSDSTQKYFIASVGLATFVFGFAAGAVLNYYLILIKSPFVQTFRASLSYKSSIFGDGIVFPVINMFAVAFVIRNRELVSKKTFRNALISGVLITLYFHLNQALRGLVNWAMPSPWRWNYLGAFHAVYMFSVASFISLFYLVASSYIRKRKTLPKEVVIVTLGVIIFLVLLQLDYIAIRFLPQF